MSRVHNPRFAMMDRMLSTIGQIAFSVSDVQRAIAFYRDTLGMKFLFQAPNLGFFDCDGIRLMLSNTEKPNGASSSVIYFKVPDIHPQYESLKARGVAFEGEPHLIAKMPDHDLWMAFFRDPDRNLLALMSEMPKA
jgi:catechol 2,3-dioxygenase-like lactoylglutathione lyase family enzyme